MQFNNNEKQQANTAFGNLDINFRNQMRLSSVRFTNENFTGSGVLVKDAENITGIITAKHNLCIRAGIETPTAWDENSVNNLIFGFLTNLNVGYDAPGIDRNPQSVENLSPKNSDIEFRAGWESWDYDLMFISFKQDLNIRTWANQDASRRIEYTRNGTGFYQQNPTNRAVFVTGFGNMLNAQGQQPTLNNYFQVRTATVTSQARQVQRHQNPNADFDAAVSAAASNNTSTAPGDSGGPMFCVYQGRVYLLGVTLGSNFAPNAMPPENPIISNEATYLYYQGSLF